MSETIKRTETNNHNTVPETQSVRPAVAEHKIVYNEMAVDDYELELGQMPLVERSDGSIQRMEVVTIASVADEVFDDTNKPVTSRKVAMMGENGEIKIVREHSLEPEHQNLLYERDFHRMMEKTSPQIAAVALQQLHNPTEK